VTYLVKYFPNKWKHKYRGQDATVHGRNLENIRDAFSGAENSGGGGGGVSDGARSAAEQAAAGQRAHSR
jgi:hypothetical protein